MQPTYLLPEIKALIRSLDLQAIDILKELIEEEKECYASYELRALHRFLKVQNRYLASNELKLEFLLSFN